MLNSKQIFLVLAVVMTSQLALAQYRQPEPQPPKSHDHGPNASGNPLQSLTTGIEITPALENGKVIGVLFRAILETSRWYIVGVRNGDIVTGSNGKKWSDPRLAARGLAELASPGLHKFRVKRDGKTIDFVMDNTDQVRK